MRTILIIAGKDLLLIWRDRLGFFWWMIGFPLLVAVLIGTIFSGLAGGPSKPMSVALVDEARSEDADGFVAAARDSGMLSLEPMSAEAARAAVRQGNVAAYVLIKPGFHTSPGLLFGEAPPVSIGLDPSRQAESLYLQAAIYDAAMTNLRRAWFDPERRPQILQAWLEQQRGQISRVELQSITIAVAALDRFITPTASQSATSQPSLSQSAARPDTPRFEILPVIDEQTRPLSSFEICFPIGIIWGLIGMVAELSISNVRERETGTWLRLRVAPVHAWQVLVGNGAACFVASLGVMGLLLLVGRLAFDVRLTNAPVLAMAVLSTAACVVGVSMLLSTLGNTESSAAGATWAFLLLMSLLGGGIVPQLFMPSWLDTVADVSFVKWSIRAIEGGIWRKYSVREVLLPCGVLLLQGTVFASAGILMGRRAPRGG